MEKQAAVPQEEACQEIHEKKNTFHDVSDWDAQCKVQDYAQVLPCKSGHFCVKQGVTKKQQNTSVESML